MDLKRCDQAVHFHAQRRRHACTVLGNFLGSIPGADAAIERRVNAMRHAAGAREKRVADACECRE